MRRFSFVALMVLLGASLVLAQVDLNQIFVINVRGTFRLSGDFDSRFNCDFCDSDTNMLNWVDDFTCPQFPDFGAEDNQERWGNPAGDGTPICFAQSGIGFQGVTGTTIQANSPNSTRIGTASHYNNVIAGGANSSPTRLRLLVTMSSATLADEFVTAFPLSFIETPNTGATSACDPSIQRSTVPCDDRFSFDAFTPSESFLSANVRYTLQITGFTQGDSNTPIKQFVTTERQVSRASVFGKIVTFCEEQECGPNQVFVQPPTCACECALTNKTCQTIFPNAEIAVDDPTCSCACIKDPNDCNATNPDIGAYNPDSCSCGCNLTNAYCKDLNPLFEVSLRGPCVCECNRQKFIECTSTNVFFEPQGAKCLCACVATDDLCKEAYGKNYKVDKKKCSCFIPGADTGLTDGEIAGIVVAAVVGPLLLILIMAIIIGVLFYLIWTGVIPGVWGYKIEEGPFGAGGNSSLYQSPWQSNSNAAAG